MSSPTAGTSEGGPPRAGTPSPESLLAVLTELDRIRAALADLTERAAPRLAPVPPVDGPEHDVHQLLLGVRRTVLGNPAAAKGLYDLLVAEGRRFAATPDGADLRERLAASEAVANLRRVWEALSLNALDGPVTPSGVPEAWAELLADVIAAHALDESLLSGLRPDGLA